MRMKVTCPENTEHKRFVTVAAVSEDWVVDETGDFVEVQSHAAAQVIHYPHPDNTWTCEECGAEATVKRT